MQTNGIIVSCLGLGPVVDIQMQSAYKVHCIRCSEIESLQTLNSLVAPVVYDALIMLRPSSHLVDSVAVPFRMSSSYLTALPINDSVTVSMLHLICAHLRYAFLSSSSSFSSFSTSIPAIRNGIVSVYLHCRSYANCLTCEISQLCYKGISRTISLGSTNGLSTNKSKVISVFRPIIVPVGKQCLGRVFNVTGTTIDGYIQLSMLSDQFRLGYTRSSCSIRKLETFVNSTQSCTTSLDSTSCTATLVEWIEQQDIDMKHFKNFNFAHWLLCLELVS